MFQLIATTMTVAALLWATALKPANAALTYDGFTIAAPQAGALLTAASQLPESFDFATAGSTANR